MRRGGRSWAHVGHFLVAEILVGVIFVSSFVESGASLLDAFQATVPNLYRWTPILAGVAISIRGLGRRSSRQALELGVVALLVMINLDLSVAALSPELALIGGEFSSVVSLTSGSQSSWILTAIDALGGGLAGVSEVLPAYPQHHPRILTASALLDGSMTLILFGWLGILLGMGELFDRYFRPLAPRARLVAHLCMAWLAGPAVVGLAASRSHRLLFRAMAGGEPLVMIILPAFFVFLGGGAWWLVLASAQQVKEIAAPRAA